MKLAQEKGVIIETIAEPASLACIVDIAIVQALGKLGRKSQEEEKPVLFVRKPLPHFSVVSFTFSCLANTLYGTIRDEDCWIMAEFVLKLDLTAKL